MYNGNGALNLSKGSRWNAGNQGVVMRSSIFLAAVALLSIASTSATAQIPTGGTNEPPRVILYEEDTPVRLLLGTNSIFHPTSFTPNFVYEILEPFEVIASIFADTTIHLSDIGKPFVATPDNDPGFAKWAELMTDGINQTIILANGPFTGAGGYECNILHGDDSCAVGVDFQGFVVDRVTFTVKEWYYDSPGRDLGHNGMWTDTYSAIRLTIEGYAVPEPHSAGLIVIGVAGLVPFRRPRSAHAEMDYRQLPRSG
jgi:hypothetical protein